MMSFGECGGFGHVNTGSYGGMKIEPHTTLCAA